MTWKGFLATAAIVLLLRLSLKYKIINYLVFPYLFETSKNIFIMNWFSYLITTDCDQMKVRQIDGRLLPSIFISSSPFFPAFAGKVM